MLHEKTNELEGVFVVADELAANAFGVQMPAVCVWEKNSLLWLPAVPVADQYVKYRRLCGITPLHHCD